MVKKQLFEKHGNFDESLFVSGTELDLCFRAKSNFSIYVDTKAKCYHDIPIKRTKNLLRTMGFIDKKRAF